MSEIDTSTTRGFTIALSGLGLSITRASMVLGAPESTIKSWIKGKRPVHPTAGIMLDMLLAGFRPGDWRMSGDEMYDIRTTLGLSQNELAVILDVETETVSKWESDYRGPPRFVANAIRWIAMDREQAWGL